MDACQTLGVVGARADLNGTALVSFEPISGMVQIGQPLPQGLGEAFLAVPVLWQVAQVLLMLILPPADVTVDSVGQVFQKLLPVAIRVESPHTWCECRGLIEGWSF